MQVARGPATLTVLMGFRTLITMAASVVLSAGSNLLLRFAMSDIDGEGLGLLLAAARSPVVLVGLFAYGTSFLLWLNVLSQARLGAAFPVYMSSTFAIIMFGSAFALGEELTLPRVAGAALIVAGIIVAESKGRSEVSS